MMQYYESKGLTDTSDLMVFLHITYLSISLSKSINPSILPSCLMYSVCIYSVEDSIDKKKAKNKDKEEAGVFKLLTSLVYIRVCMCMCVCKKKQNIFIYIFGYMFGSMSPAQNKDKIKNMMHISITVKSMII